ncbi:MAG: AtpZ/AtpI family protein [Planctomycetota bacterium]|nr:AtpZ/AtpI family protein [Planctomycetota bacterium]MDG1984906.1 AtpZ/AtpI family protein [Planctomycetota bacterium]
MSTSNDPSGLPGPDQAGDAPEAEGSIPNVPGAEWVGEQREVGKAAGAGLQFGLTICVFAVAGLWLDERLGTAPWLLVAGVLLSFFGGTVSLIKKYS